jgi:hypothetical protein
MTTAALSAALVTSARPIADVGHAGIPEGIRGAPDAFGDAHQGANRG